MLQRAMDNFVDGDTVTNDSGVQHTGFPPKGPKFETNSVFTFYKISA
jgi:hypothetical protein